MYIDAYRLTMIGAILIVMIIMFGGSGEPKFRIKTKEEKWREAIEESISGNNKGLLSNLTGGGGGGNGTLSSTMNAVPQNPNSYYQYQYQYQQDLLRQQSQQAYQPDSRYGLRYPTQQLGRTAPPPGMVLPYQQSPESNFPTPGGAMGADPGWSVRDAPVFPQAFPKWTSGPRDRLQPVAPVDGGRSQINRDFRLRSGQDVKFAGTDVFTKNEDGKYVPMPDGQYIDNTNTRTIYVRNGKRVLPNN